MHSKGHFWKFSAIHYATFVTVIACNIYYENGEYGDVTRKLLNFLYNKG